MTSSSSPSALASQALEKLSSLASGLPRPPAPPAWLTDEAARRVVLLLNHVLMQEPEARARLARQKGRVVRVQWRGWGAQLAATPGLGVFLLMAVVIGFGASWLSMVLWNVASQRLPASLCGQLIVSETLFALAYDALWSQAWPGGMQLAAAALFALGIVAAIRAHG